MYGTDFIDQKLSGEMSGELKRLAEQRPGGA
jgi:hypothetical protein